MSDMTKRQRPVVCSLQNLEIELNDEIRRHLGDQYAEFDRKDVDQHKDSEYSHLDLILAAMKRPPAYTTCRVNLIRTTRTEVLNELRSLLSSTPQLKVVESSDFSDVIDIIPAEFDKSSLSSLTRPVEDGEKNATIGNDNISSKALFSNWASRREQGWPMAYRSIICDRFCGEAVLRGSDIFVMGVMAADTNIQAGEKVAVYADIPSKDNPNEKFPRGLKLENYRGKCVYLGLGITEYSRSEIFKKTQGVAISMSRDPSDRVGPPLPPLHGVLPNEMMLQNLPSVLVGHALRPRPNDVILDMCSAPGGKTSHLASLVRNEAIIIACDKSKKKVTAAKDLFARMGASCITPLALDATKCCSESECENDKGFPKQETKDIQQILRDAPIGKEGLKQIKKFPKNSFDKILLDPPCSALGLRPKLFVTQDSLKELTKHAEYQRKFVHQAIQLLKVGGYMTYSTCTINGDENEGMVSHILSKYPCMELLQIDLPSQWREKKLGSTGLEGFGLSADERNRVCRFDPSAVGDTMGFFVALLQKRSAY